VADRRYNAKLIIPDGTEKPSLIVYYPPTLTGEEVEDIGRQILAVFSGTLCSDVEDEEGRGTTTEDMLDAGLLDSAGVLSADDSKGGWAAHVIGRELLRELADALAARCGTNAEEWPLIEQARRLLDGVAAAAPARREPWICLLCKSGTPGRHGTLDDKVTPCPNGVDSVDGGKQG
jgi:hypothetical protein